MTRKISVEIVGDSASLERSFARSGESAKKFDKEVSVAARGALAGSEAFKSMGRSLAFASTGFLGFASAAEGIKTSIEAAQKAEVTQRQLAATIKAAGSSLDLWKGQVDRAGLSLAKFGFTSDDSDAALNTLVRSTGSVHKALGVLGVAADIARAKNKTLEDSALIVGKALDGQTSGLRRLGVQLPKTASGMDLIRDAGRAFAGQAAAATTQGDKFRATLHDTEVIVGEALLPTLDHLLKSLGAWLQKMNESGRLQRDVNTAVKDFTAVAHGAEAIVDVLKTNFDALGKVVGGTKQAIELLGAAFLILKARTKLVEWGALEGGISGIGTKATIATGEVSGLRGALASLGKLGAIIVPVEIAVYRKQINSSLESSIPGYGAIRNAADSIPGMKALNNFLDGGAYQAAHSKATGTGTGFATVAGAPRQAGTGTGGLFTWGTAGTFGGVSTAGGYTGGAGGYLPTGAGGYTARSIGLTAAQILANNLIAHPDSLKFLRQQATADKASLAFAEKMRAAGRWTNQRYQQAYANYEGDLIQREQTITSILTQGAAKVAAEQKKRDAAMRIKIPTGVGGTFRTGFPLYGGSFSMGAQSYGVPMGLQLQSARDTALGDQGGLMHVALLEKAAAQKALKSGRLAIQGQIDAWNVINQANQTLGTGLAQGAKVLSSQGLVRQILGAQAFSHLGRSQLLADEARASVSQAFSRHVPTSMGVLGQSVHVEHLHLHGVQDVHGLSDALSKLSRGKQPQTVGPNAGHNRAA